MKQYKHKLTGKVFTETDNGYYYHLDMTESVPYFVIKNSNDWEEVVEIPKYVKCIKQYGNAEIGKIYNTTNSIEASILFALSWKEVLEYYKHLGNQFILSTKEEYDAQFIVPKTPILITEDNIELFEGGSYWFIWVTDSCARGQKPMTPYYVKQWTTVMGCTPADNAKYFSTKQKAQDFISINKPKYSKKQVFDALQSAGLANFKYDVLLYLGE